MSADTERSKFAETDTNTKILAKMSAETNTKTDNFLSLVNTTPLKFQFHIKIVV